MSATQTRPRTVQEGALAMFERDADCAELTVLHDDGLYRHLRVARSTGPAFDHQFQVITWPGHLTLSGGHGTWTFARTDDMLAFFRQGGRRYVNLSYWSEKLVNGASGGRREAKAFSEEVYRKNVEEALADWLDGHDLSEEHRGEATAAVGAELLDRDGWDYPQTDDQAHQLVGDFRHSIHEANPSWHDLDKGPVATVEFTDTHEWDFTDYDHHFIWSCYAIREAVWLYDAGRIAAQQLAELTAGAGA